MKLRSLVALCFAFALGASAQLTTITASNIQDGSGGLLASGTLCVGANSCASITTGVLDSLQVTNPTTAAITVTSGSKQYLSFPSVRISGTTFDFDAYIQPAGSASSGIGAPYSHCAPGASFTNTDATLYTCGSDGTWATPTLRVSSLLATGIVDGKAPVTVTTALATTLGGTYKTGYVFNQYATAATGVAYTLPTAAAGLQYCVGNSYNGTAANTGVITVNASATGQFIIFTNGTLSATGGNVTSAGAAGEFACFIGVDATHWYFRPQAGTWSKH